ncbi:formate dehydrogenase accessory sulfurtransferase FdhD [Ferrovibrio sp.]|uniref:formate dehydrogenase accessory sulfurtransferase FdhD n=1 Tax=Ferrovibrio sp. TaxID=1917215 RepID=UPI00351853E4
MTGPCQPSRRVVRQAWTGSGFAGGERAVPEETAVAITCNGSTHAVMMATPADCEDFAIGFCLSEGIVATAGEIREIEVVETAAGLDLRLWLADDRAAAYAARRRAIAGPTGCGLCGIESLDEAMRPATRVDSDARFTPDQIIAAMATLPPAQRLNTVTRAVHGAGFWEPGADLVAIREDVGRHNALDKLAGALARQGTAVSRGLLLLTSRVSVEMVQKAARLGVPALVAVSAPTSLAIAMAEQAGLTLVAVARGSEFEVFTRPDRVLQGARDHVA